MTASASTFCGSALSPVLAALSGPMLRHGLPARQKGRQFSPHPLKVMSLGEDSPELREPCAAPAGRLSEVLAHLAPSKHHGVGCDSQFAGRSDRP
jgi:hypothetical protein